MLKPSRLISLFVSLPVQRHTSLYSIVLSLIVRLNFPFSFEIFSTTEDIFSVESNSNALEDASILELGVDDYVRDFNLKESWANKAVENSAFGFHTHDRDITVVYYAKNNYPEFGTNIDEQVIIPGVEDSLLIFDGKIRHQLCNMPFELAVHPHNHRYSIVFDFNIDKSTNPDNIAK
mgnify:CR=1 FL=1